jgi:hypothetical protein
MRSEWWSKLRRRGTPNLSLRQSVDRAVVLEPGPLAQVDPVGVEVAPIDQPAAHEFDAQDRGFTFAVDAVEQATKQMWTETLGASLARRFRRKILVLSEERCAVVNSTLEALPENLRVKLDVRRIGSRLHPLVDAVHVAFSQHRPLTLSPDAIWLAIAQGFGHHVTENAETLRGRLVAHEAKRELTAEVTDLSAASFENAIADFCAQIRAATDPAIHDTLICDFSTTTPAIRTAGEIAIMDTYSSYFTYFVGCVCGIPKVTLEGTAEDWRRIRDRVEVLATFQLEWWVSRLRPILDEFVLTAEGHPTLEFWQAIYKPKQAYAATLATGWVTDLFPYLGDTEPRKRNHTLELLRTGWALPVHPGLSLKLFPSGLSSVPITVSFSDRRREPMELVGGFFAVRQNSRTLAVSPLIHWSVTEPAPQRPIVLHG